MRQERFLRDFSLLIQIAGNLELTIYDICFRRAGVAIRWCDQGKLRTVGDNNYKMSLTIACYYPTLEDAVDGELGRLMKEDAARTPHGSIQ